MKINKHIFITLMIFLAILISVLISCQIIDRLVLNKIEESDEGIKVDEQNESDNSAEESVEIKEVIKENEIIYFEIGIDENSTHFEHRVANIYSISTDDTERKLIYSDIADKYGLTSVYSISPDKTKILCGKSDDARGVYSALCYIDIGTGNLINLIEFDFSEGEEMLESIYREPIWSNSSDKIAYETITNPYKDSFGDGGIYVIDINTGIKEKINLDLEGQLLENDVFLYPVLFSSDDTKIIAAAHPYYPKIEQGEVLDYYTLNESLNLIDIESGQLEEILNINQFKGVEAESISSFDNFDIFKDSGLTIFQVLGDFEEDGDIWAFDHKGGKLTKITNDSSLREQQPSVLDLSGLDKKVTYVGVSRYGTIAEHNKSGNIYILNLNNLENIDTLNCQIEGLAPVFSPDGEFLALLSLDYDENFNFIENYQIKTYEIESNEMKNILSTSNIIDLIGWL
ncbi:MAG: hypothetical protein MUP02_04180 [Actinobacteria bacterium]|nr:hypothetical protein [Actinomycetota bacterium]